MMKILRLLSVLFFLFIIQKPVFAAPLELVLTQGVDTALPIAIVPFAGQDNITEVVRADLQNSGQFKAMDPQKMSQTPYAPNEVNYAYWRKAGMDNVVVGQVKAVGGNRYQVNFALLDVFKNSDQAQILAKNSFTVPATQMRALAHHISDIIYQQLTGARGVFSTRIVYVLVQRNAGQAPRFTLQVADADGYNPRTLLVSPQPIMSPAWSHDGTRIAYVSFEKASPRIFVQDVATGARHPVTDFPGINGAPAWSPDDSKLALALSKGKLAPKIYVMNLRGGSLQQLTQGNSIDTEPNWAPNGKSLLFTSDRGGAPQIYQLNLATKQVQRLTFTGNYNARASFSADGKNIVTINGQGGMYNIAIQNLQSGNMLILTHSGADASPSLAPNGRMVLHETDIGQRGVLGMVSTDGKVKLRIPAPDGSVQDPAWSPFLS